MGGGGTIDLGTEELDLKFDTKTRGASLASLGVPFFVGGTLAKPTASPDPLGVVANPAVVAGFLTGPVGVVGSLVAQQQVDEASGENPCVAALAAMPGQQGGKVKSTLGGAAETAGEALKDAGESISEGLKSLFGD